MDYEDTKSLESLKKQKAKAEKKGNIEEESDLCNCIGEIYTRYDQFEEAIEEHERALSLCECLGNQLKIALACRFLGECYSKKGDFDKALHLHERYLSLARACANELEEQRALTTLGCTYMLQRDVAVSRVAKLESSRKAEAAFLKSLEICENLKSKTNETEYMDMLSRLSLNLGLLYDGLGETENSQKWFMKALGISQKYSLLEVLYLCQCNLADFLKKATKVSDARKYIDAALITAHKMKNKQYEVDVLHSKALIDVQLEDFAMARHSLKKCHRMTCTNREHAQKFIKLYKTVKTWEETNRKLAEIDDEDFEARILLYDKLGDCAVELCLFKKAILFYLNMLSVSQSAQKDGSCLAMIHVSIAETYKDSGQLEKAISHYRKEIECHGDNNHDQVCQSWLNVAVLQEQCGVKYKLIQKSYFEAYNAAKKANHKKLQVRALMCLSELCKMHKDEKALHKTQEKLAHVRKKYCITDTDLEDDSQAIEDIESDGDDDEDIIMSDLTDSEEEEKVVNSIKTCTRSGTRTQRIKVNDYGETPLHRACIDGNLDRVRKLLADGHPLNPQDNNGWTPLHEAANNNHYEVTECLLRAGADVNNRGGKGCKGMTPLIDAASNGHIEIMKLLIEYGAGPCARDDDQMTALDHLIERGNDVDFDRSTEIQYHNMVELLKERSSASRGITKNCKALAQLTTSALIPTSPSSNQKKHRPVLLRTDIIEDGDSDESDTDQLQSRVVSTKNALNRVPLETESDADLWSSSSEEPDFEHNATEAYRKAICNVGRSAYHSSQSSKAVTLTRTANTSEKPALLPEQEMVDDWLINDIQPNTKRRKYDVDYCLSTRNAKGCRRHKSVSPVRKSSSGKMKSSSMKQKSSKGSDLVMITESDDSALNDNIVMSNDVGFSETDLKDNDAFVEHFACENVSAQQNTQPASFAGGGDTVCTNSLVKSRNCVMKLTVQIEDKCLIIPVIDHDGTKTFAWLAEEAASRYYKMWGLKLKLTLGKDGAHFLPDDLVSLMLSDNDKIDSFLESRDQQPSMTESYLNACKALNIIAYKNVQTLLQLCEVSGKLNLSDMALRTIKFQPVIKSIQHQSCLRELNLKGNRLGDTGIENLCKVLPSITNLTLLGLACNDLTVEGLKCLCATVTSGNSKALQNLKILDLGHNPLYDGCLLQIATLVRSLLQLTTLCLSSCQLTTEFFQNDRIKLTEALHQSSIHHFDVSYNSFGCVGVELFLKCQNPSKILCLNLTSTIDDFRSSQVYRHLYNYMSQDGCSLQELDLCNCHLGMENSDFLIRLPAVAKHLQRLNISSNTKLNNNVLQQILVTSACDSSHLEDIMANDCGLRSPLSVDFMDALTEKLAAAVPLKKLEFTCFMLEKVDITSLTQVWKDKWENFGTFSCDGHKVTMSVLDT